MPNKRKRGRPKKEPKQLPIFKSASDIRKYLINEGLRLSLELIELATKKNNIKKPAVVRAKTQQYKTALESLKLVNSLLKDKQLTEIKYKLQLMKEGITASLVAKDIIIEPSESVLNAVEELNKQIVALKGWKNNESKKVIEEELTNQVKNFTIEETESYLELLLTKSFRTFF